MDAPLYEKLKALAAGGSLRMHMPGHKGKLPCAPELAGAAALDFTELGETGNLYEGGGPIGAAEGKAAGAYGYSHAQFLTGGATQGIYAALCYAARRGKEIWMCRGSHFSAYNACGLLDLQPRFLQQGVLHPFGCCGPVEAAEVARALKMRPAAAVLITSPSYYGVLSDLKAIGAVCRAHGALLIVDGAHGAHLPFLPGFKEAMAGADILVCSAHKTLPALGQTALLFSTGEEVEAELRTISALFGTSSPSYALMASLDAARAYMAGPGAREYARAAAALETLRAETAARGRFPVLSGPGLDPLRLVLCTAGGGLAGPDAVAILEKEFSLVVEMADKQNLLCIVTGQDSGGDLRRLAGALEALEGRTTGIPLPAQGEMPPAAAALSPGAAFRAPRKRLPLGQTAGRLAGQQILVYPPGLPLVAAGEIIEEKHLAYLREMRYNMNRPVEVLSE